MSESLVGASEPVREASDAGTRVSNQGPLERLHVYGDPAGFSATLLFLEGRAATPLSGGGSAWADLEGGRVVTFDARGLVDAVLGGAPPEGGALTQPGFVAFDATGLLAVELDGRALRFEGREPVRWEAGPTPWGGVGAEGLVAAARTVFDIQIAPLSPTEPLVWVSAEGRLRGIGQVRMPEQAMLAPVVNAGWVAPSPQGDVFFASAVRPELHRYRSDGAQAWVSVWEHPGAYEPTFGITGGTLTPKFRLVQQAVAVGPDGLVYVLATGGDEGPADRLLVFDLAGRLVREAEVDPFAALYVGPAGHVFSVPADEALARTPSTAASAPFAPFELPRLGGADTVRLRDHEGKVVVVNFWASWCAPCRREMPLLDELQAALPADRVTFIGLNEDVRLSDALDFLEEIGGVGYPLAWGEGALRERYGYRGLPYTLVIGRDGRVLKAFYGFGASITPIEDAVRRALAEP